MDRAPPSQMYSNMGVNPGAYRSPPGPAAPYSSGSGPNAMMYSSGPATTTTGNGGLPSSSTMATLYATPAHASPHQAIHPSPTHGATQQNLSHAMHAPFTAYSTGAHSNGGGGGGAPIANGGTGGGFYYSAPTGAAVGTPTIYPTNSSAAAVFPLRGGSNTVAPSPTAAAPVMAPQAHVAAAAAAAAAAWTSAAANINAGSKLFVGQVPAVCTEDQLRPLFAQFGSLLEIKIMREPNGRSKGSAWVRYELEESAQRAIAVLNDRHIVPPQTNPLRVQFAVPSANRTAPIPAPTPPATAAPLTPHSLSTMSAIMPIYQQQQQHQQQNSQPNYAPPATYAAPHGYAGTATAYMSGQYATSTNLMAVRTNPPPSSQQQQQQQVTPSVAGKLDYFSRTQPGSLLYPTAAPTGVSAMAAQQQQQQQQQNQPSRQMQLQQQHVVYTSGGPMRSGVMYAPETFAMTNQIASPHQQPPSSQQHSQQQQHQWCS